MRSHALLISSVIFLFGIAGAASAQELNGRWPCGNWIDTNTGHEGPLKSHFRQTDDCYYRVVFTGRFAKVIPFRFATTLNVVDRDGDKVFFAGESRLMGFYRFTYNAVADEHQFNARSNSRRWMGEFNLNR